MGVDFRLIWAADFDNVIRLYDPRPPAKVTCSSPKFKRDDRYIIMIIVLG